MLTAMQQDCPGNTRRQLADFTANTLVQLEDAGVDASPSEILADVRQSSSLEATNNCLDLFALYAILRREQG